MNILYAMLKIAAINSAMCALVIGYGKSVI
jgi:hypothetical protein